MAAGEHSGLQRLKMQSLADLELTAEVELSPAAAQVVVAVLNESQFLCRAGSEIDGLSFYQGLAANLDLQLRCEDTRPELAKIITAAAAEASAKEIIANIGRFQIPVGEGAPIRGGQNARVRIVSFSDFECPYCMRAATTLDQIINKYPDDVQLVFLHFPLGMHQNAMRAALAVEAAGNQGKFWELHDLVWNGMQNGIRPTDEYLVELAQQLELDMPRWQQDRASGEVKARVEAQQQLGTELGVRATPTLFVNGIKLRGAQPFAIIDQLLQEELQKSE